MQLKFINHSYLRTVIYATSDEAVAYMFYSFFPSVKNMRTVLGNG